ncbi:unnamed protein product, partial [Amoebophrya sp. A25]|eukprot:GSA25T00006899001.1
MRELRFTTSLSRHVLRRYLIATDFERRWLATKSRNGGVSLDAGPWPKAPRVPRLCPQRTTVSKAGERNISSSSRHKEAKVLATSRGVASSPSTASGKRKDKKTAQESECEAEESSCSGTPEEKVSTWTASREHLPASGILSDDARAGNDLQANKLSLQERQEAASQTESLALETLKQTRAELLATKRMLQLKEMKLERANRFLASQRRSFDEELNDTVFTRVSDLVSALDVVEEREAAFAAEKEHFQSMFEALKVKEESIERDRASLEEEKATQIDTLLEYVNGPEGVAIGDHSEQPEVNESESHEHIGDSEQPEVNESESHEHIGDSEQPEVNESESHDPTTVTTTEVKVTREEFVMRAVREKVTFAETAGQESKSIQQANVEASHSSSPSSSTVAQSPPCSASSTSPQPPLSPEAASKSEDAVFLSKSEDAITRGESGPAESSDNSGGKNNDPLTSFGSSSTAGATSFLSGTKPTTTSKRSTNYNASESSWRMRMEDWKHRIREQDLREELSQVRRKYEFEKKSMVASAVTPRHQDALQRMLKAAEVDGEKLCRESAVLSSNPDEAEWLCQLRKAEGEGAQEEILRLLTCRLEELVGLQGEGRKKKTSGSTSSVELAERFLRVPPDSLAECLRPLSFADAPYTYGKLVQEYLLRWVDTMSMADLCTVTLALADSGTFSETARQVATGENREARVGGTTTDAAPLGSRGKSKPLVVYPTRTSGVENVFDSAVLKKT